jgi:Spy/CpxP family protein refolding chaperone
MKANKTMLIAALAVGSLLVWSPALRADDTNSRLPLRPQALRRPASHPRAGFDRMAEQLNLTADQKPKVQSIMDSAKAENARFAQGHQPVAGRPQAKRKIVAEEMAQQMKAVLTPEQFDKWQKTSPMGPGPRRFRPDAPPAGAGSTNAPAAPPKQ